MSSFIIANWTNTHRIPAEL